MKVYLDENNICHDKPQSGYVEADHEYFDDVAPEAFICYKYVPEHNFIQCINSKKADRLQAVFAEQLYKDALAKLGVET